MHSQRGSVVKGRKEKKHDKRCDARDETEGLEGPLG